MTRLTWKTIARGVCVAHDDVTGWTWVMQRNRFAGKRNRWDLIRVYHDESTIKALECPPGHCRRIARECAS